MRKQYHFRRVGEDTLIWDVGRLAELAAALPREEIPLTAIRELDEPYWFRATGTVPTCRRVLEHVRLVREADPRFPVILCAEGRVMDGMHRVGQAFLDGRRTIAAVRFPVTPEPDFRNRRPEDLDYSP